MSQIIPKAGAGHIDLTCQYHTKLVWSTKNFGIENPDGSIQFHRSIFFRGRRNESTGEIDRINKNTGEPFKECTCKGSDLRIDL